MAPLRITDRPGDYELIDGKFIQNTGTGRYLRHIRDSFVEESGGFNSGDADFHWQIKDGKVLSYHGVVYAGDVEGEVDEDVPVNRAAALIEAALNAKAAGCGCDCGCGPDCAGCACDCGCLKPVEETPVEETPVEETPVEETPVEETPVEETPVEEAAVEEAAVEEDDVPDLVEADE
jgi:hypothetical protein